MYWSDSLRAEMRLDGTGVEVLGITVGKVVNSRMKDLAPSLFTPSSRDFARTVLQKVGCGLPNVVSYWAHHVQVAALEMTPGWIADRVIAKAAIDEMADERKGL